MSTDMKAIVLCDFDGTITNKDVYDSILKTFSDGSFQSFGEKYDSKKITFEKMNKGFVTGLRCSAPELDRYIQDNISIRLGFSDFLYFLSSEKIGLTIVSCGLDLYIRQVLKEYDLSFVDSLEQIGNTLEGKAIAIACNKVVQTNLGRKFVSYPVKNDRWAPDKARIGSYLITQYGVPVICIGDGPSDFELARISDFVFATSALADYCLESGISFLPFKNFNDIAGAILKILSNQTDLVNKIIKR